MLFLHAFAIGKYPVTNIEYARFVEATGHHAPKYWIEGTYPTEKATHPVTGVTIKDAKAYCKWLSKKTSEKYRLPTEWEWEWAATGPLGQQYPWGEQFDKDKCNTLEAAHGGTTPVDTYIDGTNQYGTIDMIGNVWEITQGYAPSSLVVGEGLKEKGLKEDFAEALSALEKVARIFTISVAVVAVLLVRLSLGILRGVFTGVLRGGAFTTPSDRAICFSRREYSKARKNVGFRCVKEV